MGYFLLTAKADQLISGFHRAVLRWIVPITSADQLIVGFLQLIADCLLTITSVDQLIVGFLQLMMAAFSQPSVFEQQKVLLH